MIGSESGREYWAHGCRPPRYRSETFPRRRPRRTGGDAQPAALRPRWPGAVRPLSRRGAADLRPALRRRGALRGRRVERAGGRAGPAWDAVILVRYPSRQVFCDMVADPEHQKRTAWRTQALEEAVLQATTAW